MEIAAKVANSPTPFTNGKRVYNIALYGLSGSGKTCMLAALAMDRYSNPFGFAATWLTTSGQTGKDWLNKAIAALENNQVPPPNSNNAQRLTFDFKFSYLGSSYQVRMFDYAGELVSPNVSDSENAQSLFDALKDMDALLILAPAPRPSQDKGYIVSKDLHDLGRTFATLGTKIDPTRRKLPIALVYNKWDLRSELEHETPENEWKELEEYLQLTQNISANAYRKLYYDLKSGAIYKPDDPYQPGDLWRLFCAFKAGEPIRRDLMPFPLSAFGEYETVFNADGTSFDRPKEINPLHSFGLEDPFFWAIFRCQELEAEAEDQADATTIERLERAANRMDGMGRYYGFLALPDTGRLVEEAKQLRDRLSGPGAAQRRYPELQARRIERLPQAEALYTRLRNAWTVQSATALIATVIMVGTLTLAAEAAWDGYAFSWIQTVADNPQATFQDRQHAEAWQDEYAHSPAWRHVLYSWVKGKNQVALDLQAARNGRGDKIAAVFTDPSKNLTLRFEKAKEYLRICTGAGCTHVADAFAIEQEYQQAQDKAAWEQARLANTVEAINAYLKQYPQGSYTGDASQARQQLQAAQDDAAWEQAKLASTEDAINTYIGQYPLGNHAEEARAALGQLMKNKDWQAFKTRYDEYIGNGDVLEAAKLLEDRPASQDSNELKLRADFPALAAELLSTKLVTWKERQEWTEAMGYLQQITQIPGDVWPIEQRQQAFNTLTDELKLTWDRTLYQTAVDFRTRDKMSVYIAQAPLGTMKAEVEHYLEYLNQRAADNNFQLMLTRVQWNDNAPGKTYATFVLNVQGQTAESLQMDGPRFKKIATVDLPLDFQAKYNDTIVVVVQVAGDGLWGSKIIGASEATKLKVQDMVEHGAQLTLNDGSGVETGQAFLTLSGGVAAEPDLPAWRAP